MDWLIIFSVVVSLIALATGAAALIISISFYKKLNMDFTEIKNLITGVRELADKIKVMNETSLRHQFQNQIDEITKTLQIMLKKISRREHTGNPN